MGNFRFEIEAVGGHGCNRDAKVGEEVIGCGRMGCPDCEVRAFAVRAIQGSPSIGTFVSARLVHWPGHADEVVDEYSLADAYPGAPAYVPKRINITRTKRDFTR